jgi:hypothetical protein
LRQCWKCLLLLAMMGALAPWSRAQTAEPDPPDLEANPARPTVANPATLTPVGYFQFESGLLGTGNSPELSSSFSFNEVIKLTVASRLELVASSTPFQHSRADGKSGNSVSDVTAGAQFLFWHGEGSKPTLAVAYYHRTYDGGAPDLDIGGSKNSVVLLASADVKGFHYDANAIFNEQVNGVLRRGQFGQTISISHPLVGKFSLGGELWHFTQPFVKGNAVGNLWNVAYAARKNLVFDAGFDVGLTGTSTPWEVFAGFTYVLPHRLW